MFLFRSSDEHLLEDDFLNPSTLDVSVHDSLDDTLVFFSRDAEEGVIHWIDKDTALALARAITDHFSATNLKE